MLAEALALVVHREEPLALGHVPLLHQHAYIDLGFTDAAFHLVFGVASLEFSG